MDGAIEIPGCLSDTQVGEKLIEFEEAVATSPSTLGKSFSDATQIRLSMCAFLASHLKQVQRAAFYSSIDKYLMYESFGSPFVYDALTKNVQSRRDAALLDLAVAEETLRAKPTDIHALSVHAAISAAIGDSQTTRRDIESLGVLAPELRERLSNALYHLGSR